MSCDVNESGVATEGAPAARWIPWGDFVLSDSIRWRFPAIHHAGGKGKPLLWGLRATGGTYRLSFSLCCPFAAPNLLRQEHPL